MGWNGGALAGPAWEREETVWARGEGKKVGPCGWKRAQERGVSWAEEKGLGSGKRAEVREKGEGEVGRTGFDWARILG